MKLAREEFEALALEQLDMVYRVARTLTRNAAESEDLVQETYLRALRGWEGFELRSHGIRPWLVRILHNIHFTRSSREARQPKAMQDQDLESMADAAQDEGTKWEANEELQQAVQQLPVDLRTVLMLWAVDDFSYQEIADAVEIPLGTVMSRLHRARQRLRQILQGVTAADRQRE